MVGIIDDDKRMLQALTRLLTIAGYDVLSFSSADAFLKDPRRAAIKFLVVDVQLPNMTGFDLQKKLIELGENRPIAFISAFDEENVFEQARALGAVLYLRKPFPTRELIDIIRNTIGEGTLKR